MGLTKSERRTLVAWGCLTVGVTAGAAACSTQTRNFASNSDGGTSSAAGTETDPAGGASASGGSPGSGTNGGTGDPAAGMSAGGVRSGTGGAGADGGSSEAGSAAGGGGGVGGAEEPVVPGPSVCDGATTVLGVNEAYIDNFETTVRFQGWYSFSDSVPPNEPKLARVAGGAVSTGYRAQVTVTNINAQGYNAGLGFNLIDPTQGKCVDLSAFDGISFWARGTSPSDQIVFQLIVPASQPANIGPPGDCLQDCYGHPHRVFTIGDAWQRFTIPFTELSDQPAAFDGHALMFNFVTYDTSWDISIDEVTFYKGTPPAGAVTPN